MPGGSLLIRGALVVDGSGGRPYRADALLRDGRITAIHREGDPGPRPTLPPPGRSIDADGLALTPGFVDAAYLVPHGTLRALALGWTDRPATPAELARMEQQLATALTEGAVGLSAGLTYSPGMYAGTDELVALCRTVAAFDGYFSPHHRSYGAHALDAYAEMVDVARRSGCALHLAHATMNFQVNAGRAGELTALLDAALADGVDLTLDSYPYLPGSTTLAALLPGWATAGGPEQTLARLADPAARAAIRTALEQQGSDGCHGVVADWDTVQISGVRNPALRPTVGLTISQLARRDSMEPFSAYADLLRADSLGTTILQHVGHEQNVRAIMRHPAHTGGSDGLLTGDRPHPRAWGTFPRYLGHYVREEGVLGLAECVEHLSARPARRLRLPDRGLVRPGYRADLVLLDPDTVAAGATYEQPRTPPRGIPFVLVDGVPVVDDHRRTGATPGRAVRRSP